MKRLNFLIPLALLAALVFLRLLDPPFLEDIRLKIFDGYQHIRPRPYEKAPVAVIDIDEESLKRLGQWPWPRTRIAELIGKLNDAGASAIALDMVFPEPDRTSPQNILPLWEGTEAHRLLEANLASLPDHDKTLAQIIQKSRVVNGFALLNEPNPNRPSLKTSFGFTGKNPGAHLAGFKGAVMNLPEIENSSPVNGCINNLQERDGIIRRVPLVFRLGEDLYPSLAAGAAALHLEETSFLIRHAEDGGKASFMASGITALQTHGISIPTEPSGRMWLYDTGYVPGRFIPAWKILAREIDTEEIQGKILFIGTSAVGLKDLRITPLNPAAAGVEIHAQLAEQILLGRFLRRPPWAGPAEGLYLALSGIFLAVLMPIFGAWGGFLAASFAIAGAVTGAWQGFLKNGLLLDPFFPAAGLLALYVIISFLNFLKTEKEKRQVRTAFSRYLSPALVAELVKHPEKLTLGGQTRTLTLLFVDIRDFSAIAENLDAQTLTQFINRFLTPMSEIILKAGGTIDKYIGDCIMAFWNAPLDDRDHALHACQAALNMRNFLVGWNIEMRKEAEAQQKTFAPIRIGIGINTGECCVGNMGSAQRFDYSVLGDEVNLASRLEGQSKLYGTDIVLGPRTVQNLGNLAALELDLLRVKGKTKPVKVFGLLGDGSLAGNESFKKLQELQERMLASYRSQEWEKALGLIEECRALDNARTRLAAFYQLYADRLAAYRQTPPPADWDGVAVATFK